MRYILITFAGPERVASWEAMSAAEKQADIARVMAWFGEHGAAGRIAGGEELGWPKSAKTVRKRDHRRALHRDQGGHGRLHRG